MTAMIVMTAVVAAVRVMAMMMIQAEVQIMELMIRAKTHFTSEMTP